MILPIRPSDHARRRVVLALILGVQACGGGDGSASGFASASASAGSSTTGTTAEEPDGSTSATPTTSGTTAEVSSSTGATSTGDASATGDASTGAATTGEVPTCEDGVAWVRPIDIDADSLPIEDLAIDAHGNSLIVGSFAGQADFGGGPLVANGAYEDAYITKYGPLGEHLWSRRYGGEEHQRLSGVAVDATGNVFVTGKFRDVIDFGGGPLQSVSYDDIVLAKLRPDGEHLWSKSFGGSKIDFGRHVAADGAGNVILAAQTDGAVDFGGGPRGQGTTAHVVKFSPDGALVWHRAYGSDAGVGDVTVDPDDNIIAVGGFIAPVDFGAGVTVPADNANLFILKLDRYGEFMWFKQNGGTHVYDGPSAGGVKTDAAGNIHLAGKFANTAADVWIAVLSPDGEHLWSSAHGVGQDKWQSAHDVSANPAGQTVVTGSFDGAIDLGGMPFGSGGDGAEAFVGRFAPDGSHELSRAFQGNGSYSGDAVAIDEQGGIWVAGYFNQPFEVGGEQLAPKAGYDGYVIRLCP
jgi:hypothetical protein